MENNTKLVEFDKWCSSCKFKDKSSTAEPCDSCLSVPARESSHKPEYWQEGKKSN